MSQFSSITNQAMFGFAPLLAQQGRGLFKGSTIWLIVLVALLIAGLVFFAIFARYCRLWIQSFCG
jgi:hypothetical protein